MCMWITLLEFLPHGHLLSCVSVTLKKILQLRELLHCYNYICLYFSRIAMLSHYKWS